MVDDSISFTPLSCSKDLLKKSIHIHNHGINQSLVSDPSPTKLKFKLEPGKDLEEILENQDKEESVPLSIKEGEGGEEEKKVEKARFELNNTGGKTFFTYSVLDQKTTPCFNLKTSMQIKKDQEESEESESSV
jgi:hypothetical protein